MLLKGENILSSEGFPGEEDSSVEERQVSAEPHAPPSFPSGTLSRSATRERSCGGSAGALQTSA